MEPMTSHQFLFNQEMSKEVLTVSESRSWITSTSPLSMEDLTIKILAIALSRVPNGRRSVVLLLLGNKAIEQKPSMPALTTVLGLETDFRQTLQVPKFRSTAKMFGLELNTSRQ